MDTSLPKTRTSRKVKNGDISLKYKDIFLLSFFLPFQLRYIPAIAIIRCASNATLPTIIYYDAAPSMMLPMNISPVLSLSLSLSKRVYNMIP
jgi:hypothetical protein